MFVKRGIRIADALTAVILSSEDAPSLLAYQLGTKILIYRALT